MKSMFDIVKFCKVKKECADVQYLKVATSENNPQLSKSMRYSQYLRATKSNTVIETKPTLNPVKIYNILQGSVSGNILTVYEIISGEIQLHHILNVYKDGGPVVGFADNTAIIQFLTGTGGAGTYYINIPHDLPASDMISSIEPYSFAKVIPRNHGQGYKTMF